MPMIFDCFATKKQAAAFVTEVKRSFGLDGRVFTTEEASYEHDDFPFALDPVIAHINRPDFDRDDFLEVEDAVERLVKKFGGKSAGT